MAPRDCLGGASVKMPPPPTPPLLSVNHIRPPTPTVQADSIENVGRLAEDTKSPTLQ